MDFFTIVLIILNLPALFAMFILLNRNNDLRILERICWTVLAMVLPIVSLILFTVKTQTVAARRAQLQRQ